MAKRKTEDEAPKKKVEGYVDEARNVFVVTSGFELLTGYEPRIEKSETEVTNIKELLNKYRPDCLK